MFSFFKTSNKSSKLDLSVLVSDMHSHLVPGVDDGSPDVETSMRLINGMQELGYQKCITTPHVMWDFYPNTDHDILENAGKVQNELKEKNSTFQLSAAAEYLVDDHFDQELEKGARLLTLSRNLVLVEFSFVNTPFNAKEIFFTMQMKGYQPVLAHPERYLYLNGTRQVFDELKSAGCLLQVNLLSLCGYYGRSSQDLANYLVGKKMVDLLGTDMHHDRHLATLLRSASIGDTVKKCMDTGKILNPTL